MSSSSKHNPQDNILSSSIRLTKEDNMIIFPKSIEVLQFRYMKNDEEVDDRINPLKVIERKRKMQEEENKILLRNKQKFKKTPFSKEKTQSEIKNLESTILTFEKDINEKETMINKQFDSEKDRILELDSLIGKWKKACQSALSDLRDKLQSQSFEEVKLSYLIGLLNIEPQMLNYDKDGGRFVDDD